MCATRLERVLSVSPLQLRSGGSHSKLPLSISHRQYQTRYMKELLSQIVAANLLSRTLTASASSAQASAPSLVASTALVLAPPAVPTATSSGPSTSPIFRYHAAASSLASASLISQPISLAPFRPVVTSPFMPAASAPSMPAGAAL